MRILHQSTTRQPLTNRPSQGDGRSRGSLWVGAILVILVALTTTSCSSGNHSSAGATHGTVSAYCTVISKSLRPSNSRQKVLSTLDQAEAVAPQALRQPTAAVIAAVSKALTHKTNTLETINPSTRAQLQSSISRLIKTADPIIGKTCPSVISTLRNMQAFLSHPLSIPSTPTTLGFPTTTATTGSNLSAPTTSTASSTLAGPVPANAPWRVQLTATGEVLTGIACASTTSCTAIGYLQIASGGGKGAIRYTTDGGASWAAGSMPAQDVELSGAVACPGMETCFADGGGLGANSGAAGIDASTNGG